MKAFYGTVVGVLVFALSGCVTMVRPSPPPVRAEVVGGAPYPKAIWREGHWVWRRGGYVWVPGHWTR